MFQTFLKLIPFIERFFYSLRSRMYAPFFKKIGKGVSIGSKVTFVNMKLISIGNNVFINNYCWISAFQDGDITIKDNVLIGPNVKLFTSNHVFKDGTVPIAKQGLKASPIIIEEDVWIGTGVTVLPGVTIHKGSVIGAGAVVKNSIPAHSIAVGVPAKVVKRRF